MIGKPYPSIFVTWAGTLCFLIGCSSPGSISDKDIRQIGFAELTELLEASDDYPVVIVDVRSPRQFAQEHVPDAVNIPLPDLSGSDHRLMGVRRIVVYSGGEHDYLSAAAAKRLLALGFSEVFDFRGGLAMWRNHQQIDEDLQPNLE